MNKKPKILIVDDRPENLLTLRRVLRDLEVELVEAGSLPNDGKVIDDQRRYE